MSKKVNISYTINEEELLQKLADLLVENFQYVKDTLYSLGGILRSGKIENKDDFLASMNRFREKLFDVDLRASEVYGLLKEYWEKQATEQKAELEKAFDEL